MSRTTGAPEAFALEPGAGERLDVAGITILVRASRTGRAFTRGALALACPDRLSPYLS